MTRDELVHIMVEESCNGCVETPTPDGYHTWTPAQFCPVHGEDTREFWDGVNRELARREL